MNLVPVVAKADTLTKAEMERLKVRLRTEIAEHGIRVYQLPDCDTDEDEEYKEQVRRQYVRGAAGIPEAAVRPSGWVVVPEAAVRPLGR